MKSHNEELLQNPDQKDKVCAHGIRFVACFYWVMGKIREERVDFFFFLDYYINKKNQINFVVPGNKDKFTVEK